MGFLDELLGIGDDKPSKKRDWDVSVFDRDRFSNRKSGNWVDWEDVSLKDVDTEGFEHPNFDDNGEW